MTRLPMLVMAGVLAAAPRASAACRWFGTQLECDVGASRVVIGTQAAEAPTYGRRDAAWSSGNALSPWNERIGNDLA